MDTENEATETLRNWTEEKVKVDELGSKNWFKPESKVSYQVTFQDEGGADYEREFDERTITQVDFKISVTGGGVVGEAYTWTITKGGPDSLYGQLVNVFAVNKMAKGVTVEVTAVGDGKSRRYLVK